MCLTSPGRVVALEPGVAVVELGDRLRRALTLLTPGVRVGDEVLISAGAVVACLDPARVAAMRAAHSTAIGPHGPTAGRGDLGDVRD